MGCNKDSRCLTIANNTYPELQNEINSSIKTITSLLNDITSELNILQIPEDYLGEKVKKELELITSNLSNDQIDIASLNGNIGMFIGRKIEEHQSHYNIWKNDQEQLKKKKEEQNKI